MRRLQGFVAPLLVALLLCPGSAFAQSVVTPQDLDQAVSAQLGSDAEARQAIQSLLAREDVRAYAQGYGLDVSRASAAVATLQGNDLHALAQQANAVDAGLSGGDPVIRISLIAALLIIIIVILIVD
jgi:hypothetical protein